MPGNEKQGNGYTSTFSRMLKTVNDWPSSVTQYSVMVYIVKECGYIDACNRFTLQYT